MISLAYALFGIFAMKYGKEVDGELFVITGFLDVMITFIVTMAISGG